VASWFTRVSQTDDVRSSQSPLCRATLALGRFDNEEHACLGQQARDWLKADLNLWAEQAGSEDAKVRKAVHRSRRQQLGKEAQS
jgi:hypothetical protein